MASSGKQTKQRRPETANQIKMAALSRRFQLGCYYDYISDSIVNPRKDESCVTPDEPEQNPSHWDANETIDMSDSLCSSVGGLEWDFPFYHRTWNPSNEELRHRDSFKLRVDVLSFNRGPTSKWDHMKLNQHLRASIAADLIDKYRGAFRYLQDESDTTQIVRTIRVRLLGKKHLLQLNPKELPMLDKATHVVSGIKYGAEAYVVFQHHLLDGQVKEVVEEELEAALQILVNGLIDQIEPELNGNWLGKFYSDLHDNPRDCSLSGAFRLIRDLIESLEFDPALAVPLAIYLQPLSTAINFSEVDDSILEECRRIIDDLGGTKALAQALLKYDERLILFPHIAQSLRLFVDYLTRYLRLFRLKLQGYVLSIRYRMMDHQKILDMVGVRRSFDKDNLNEWLVAKTSELQTLHTISITAGQKAIMSIHSKNKLENILLDTRLKRIVVLHLPGTVEDDYLSSMKQCVEGDLEETAVHPISRQDRNEASGTIRSEMMKTARSFFQQAERFEDGVGFVLAISVLTNAVPCRPSISLYEDGQLVNSDFRLPVQPKNVRFKSEDVTVFGLEWDCDQLEDVLHFIVQYKRRNEPTWSPSLSTSGAVTSIQSLPVEDPSGYQFRVAAVSLVGPSEFSSVLEIQQHLNPAIQSAPVYQDQHVSNQLKDIFEQIEQLHIRVRDLELRNDSATPAIDNKLKAEESSLLQFIPKRLEALESHYESLREEVKQRLNTDWISELRGEAKMIHGPAVSHAVPEHFEYYMNGMNGGAGRIVKEEMLQPCHSVPEEIKSIQTQMNETKNLLLSLQKQMAVQEVRVRDFRTVFAAFAATNRAAVPLFRVSCASSRSEASHYVTYGFQEVYRNDVYGSFDKTTGHMTAGMSGIYFFSFSAVASTTGADIHLRVNGKDRALSRTSNAGCLAINTLLELKAGDKVGVFVSRGSLLEMYAQGNGHATHFFAILLTY